jgi:hypothetical protein
MTDSEILDVIGKELYYYRRRQWIVFYYALFAEATIVTAHAAITVSSPTLLKILCMVTMAWVGIAALFISHGYTRRILGLREVLVSIINRELQAKGLCAQMPAARQLFRPRGMYRLTIVLITIVAIAFVWAS